MIVQGDCLEVLKSMESNSIDAIVTDPPYGLAFMGKRWDYDVPSADIWRECLRVLKPGGHLLAFGGTRTFHRTVVNIEDAGFEVRDMIAWIHGQGFPKSMDVSKAIDKEAGAEREVIGRYQRPDGSGKRNCRQGFNPEYVNAKDHLTQMIGETIVTAPATEAAKQWEGFGTALKPAIEPICMARKPIAEKTVAKNVLRHRCGGINVDGCRVETTETLSIGSEKIGKNTFGDFSNDNPGAQNPLGRFPANLVFSHTISCTDTECAEGCAVKALDEQSGILKTGGTGKSGDMRTCGVTSFGKNKRSPRTTAGDAGGASRFFYCAKPSGKERGDFNTHPTVKSLDLMAYLCRLITPPGGLILDPFSGSGSTGVAAIKEGFRFMGIERESDYVNIAMKRLSLALGEADPLNFL